MSKFTFDGDNKLISIVSGTLEADIKSDIYSAWKDWVHSGSNSAYLRAIRTVGGDPIDENTDLGDTYFLMNEWRIKPYDGTYQIQLNGNLYHDDGVYIAIPPDGTDSNVMIRLQTSNLIQTSLINQPEIEYSSYQNSVTVNISGSAGTEFPIGTPVSPVNNISDAISIAETRGFSTINFTSNFTLTSGDVLTDYELVGQDIIRTRLTIETEALVLNTIVKDCFVEGILDGGTVLRNCRIGELSYVNGYIFDSSLENVITLGGGANATIIDCYRGDRFPIGDPPTINMGGGGQQLGLRRYGGGVKIMNMTGSDGHASIDLTSGKVVIDSTVTNGEVIVRGVGMLFDNSTESASVDSSGFMNKETVADAVLDTSLITYSTENTVASALQLSSYDNAVWVDPTSSYSGSAYPIGTREQPVNNLTDAKLIAEDLNFNVLQIPHHFTFNSSTDLEDYNIYGGGHQTTKFLLESGSDLHGCQFYNTEMSGSSRGMDSFVNCHVVDLTLQNRTTDTDKLSFTNCLLQGNIKFANNYTGDVQILDCWALPDGESSIEPILDLNDGAMNIQLRGFSGRVQFTNSTQPDNKISVNLSGGLTLASSVTTGSVSIAGVGILLDNSTGAIVNSDALMSKDTVAIAVWDEPVIQHTGSETTGRSTLDQSYEGFVYIDIDNGISGSDYPYGTPTNPVSNLTQAITIGNRWNIADFKLAGTLILDQSVSGYSFHNYGNGKIDLNNQVALATQFHDLKIWGVQNTVGIFEDCRITNLQGISGIYKNCYFLDSGSMMLGTGQILFDNCRSQVAGNDSPTFDASSGSVDLSVRAYSGGFKLLNYDDVDNKSTIEFVSGKLNLDSSSTAGLISARGVFGYDHQNGATCTIDLDSRAASHTDQAYVSESLDNLTISLSTESSASIANIENITLQTSASIAEHRTESEERIKYILGLSQQNFRMTDQIYDVNDNMVTATVRIYNNSTDATNDTNSLKQYAVSSSYTGDLLTSYVMKEN